MWASRHIIELIIFLIQSNAFSPPTFSLSCAFSFGSLATRIHKTAVRNALANITHFLSLIFRFPLILDDIPISPPRPLSSSPEIAVGRSKVTSQILESRQELSLIQDAVQSKLKKRTSLHDEKTYLHLLLKISESVARLESLLLIASPDGREETAQSILFALQQNIPNFSIMFPKRKPTPDLHLLTRFNGFSSVSAATRAEPSR
ncbi:hypothetical protein F5888DRAFT_1630766 [Russula emetica]|nr:hypothetical protein F5888DRAFT_1630766 [Russula emetica]